MPSRKQKEIQMLETQMFWLSFADADLPKGRQFLGVVIVQESDLIAAVQWTHMHGVNPGGEVCGAEFSELPPHISPEWIGKLLTKDDIERHMGGATLMKHNNAPQT